MSAINNNNNLDIEKAVVGEAEQENVTPVTSSRSPTKTRCLVIMVVLVLVALIIGLSVGLTNKTKKSQDEDVSSMTLEDLCLLEDKGACESVCQDSLCCFDETSGNHRECVVWKYDECDLYEPCRVFVPQEESGEQGEEEGGHSLPGSDSNTPFTGSPPTIEVETICNSEYGEVGDITCEEACWEANCCYWTGEESCYEEYTATCEEWKAAGCFRFSDPFGDAGEDAAAIDNEEGEGGFSIPGGIELEEGEILPEPGLDVYDICGTPYYASETDITCEEACATAACCYWTGEDSCYDEFKVTCDVWHDAGCFEISVNHEPEVP